MVAFPSEFRDMSALRDSSAIPVEAEDGLEFIDGVGGSNIIYTFAALILATVVLRRFADGCIALQRLLRSLNGMLGGTPHTVTLPGPPGFPLIGNLIQVS